MRIEGHSQYTESPFKGQYGVVQSDFNPRVTLNDSILPLDRTPCILGVTSDPHFKFNAHVKSLVTRVLDCAN